MKKCKKLLLFSSLFVFAGLAGLAISKASIGPATDYQRNIGLVWVFNDDYSDRGPGEVLVYKTGSRSTGVEVTTTTTYSCPYVAGVVPYGSTITARSWGWLQTSGYHPAVVVASDTSVGSFLVTSASEEQSAIYAIDVASFTLAGVETVGHTIGVSTSVTFMQGVFGSAIDAVSSDTCKAIIKIQ